MTHAPTFAVGASSNLTGIQGRILILMIERTLRPHRPTAAGKGILASQNYEIKNSLECGDQVVVEALWRGTMAVDVGSLKAHQELRAHFCIVLEFQNGKILRQRNYDCFEDFS